MKNKILKMIIFIVVLSFVLCGVGAFAQVIKSGNKQIDTKGTSEEKKIEKPGTVFQRGGVSVQPIEPQYQIKEPTVSPMLVKELTIVIQEPRDLHTAADEVNVNNTDLGSEISIRLKAEGGRPPYHWEIISEVENHWAGAYCDDPAICLPPLWTGEASSDTRSMTNNIYSISGHFTNSIPYCRDVVAVGPCDVAEVFKESLTVWVADSSAARERSVITIPFVLLTPPERISDLLFADIQIRGHDASRDDYIFLEILHDPHQLLARTYNLLPENNVWHNYRVSFESREGADLSELDFIKVNLRDQYGDLFDVDIRYISVCTKFRCFTYDQYIDDLEAPAIYYFSTGVRSGYDVIHRDRMKILRMHQVQEAPTRHVEIMDPS